MTKAELVARLAERSNLPKKTTEAVLKSLVGAKSQAMKVHGEIRIPDLGTFRVVERKARVGVNPRTGDKLSIPATRVPGFRAAKALKETVKKVK